MEHFVTLFDSRFAIFGLSLYQSLMQQRPDSCLWVLAMDEEIEAKLTELKLPQLKIIPLREVENERLLSVKGGRTAGEYCWTLTPFTITAVFDRDRDVKRVTYVDADVGFFDDPMILIQEMLDANKHVLITEHAYDPKYDQTITSGRFCVQFMTFNRSGPGLEVCQWWQDRCIEWCFARFEDNKFGDQKYLDCWPIIFGDIVHVLQATEKTLAPWNVHFLTAQARTRPIPVLYHFHKLRFKTGGHVIWYDGYFVGKNAIKYYRQYLVILQLAAEQLSKPLQLPIEATPTIRSLLGRIKRRMLKRRAVSAPLFA